MKPINARLVSSLLPLAVSASQAAAGIAYDALTTFTAPPTQIILGAPLHADDVTLDAAAGLLLTRIELLARVRSAAAFDEFNGTLTLRLFERGDVVPGAMFAEASTSLTIARATDRVVEFSFDSLLLPDRSFVVGWVFSMPDQPLVYNDVWVRQNAASLSAGSTSNRVYSNSLGNPSLWQFTSLVDRNYSIRVTTIPSPSAIASLAALGPVVLRRRRR